MPYSTLAEIATNIAGSIPVFEKYGFNYYLNGGQLLEIACMEKNLDFVKVSQELSSGEKPIKSVNFEVLSVSELINFSVELCTREKEASAKIYLQIQNLLTIESYSKALKGILTELEKEFPKLNDKLARYYDFYPYLRTLQAQRDKLLRKEKSLELIERMEQQQRELDLLMQEIKRVCGGFNASGFYPALYSSLMDSLLEFEKDLHILIHVDRNILFAKCSLP